MYEFLKCAIRMLTINLTKNVYFGDSLTYFRWYASDLFTLNPFKFIVEIHRQPEI